MHSVKFAGRRVPVPGHPVMRIILGCLLLVGGFLGFLPVLGFWMVPLGLLILAVDIPMARRFRRRIEIRFGRWLVRKSPKWASRFGFSAGGKVI
jgi:purine-cytosine permease-like protein